MSGPELCGSPKISGHFYAAGRACPAPTVLPYKKREQKSPFTLFWHSCGLAIQVFLVLEGVPGVLDIIIVVQGVQQLAHLDELIGVGQRGGGGRHLRHVGGDELVALLFQRVADSGEVLGAGGDLGASSPASKSSAPASSASIISSSGSLSSRSTTMTPFWVNMKPTQPIWPRLPPNLSK